MNEYSLVAEKSESFDREVRAIAGDTTWDSQYGKEGLEYSMGIALAWMCYYPLFTVVLIVHSVYYSLFRNDLCPDLNHDAFIQLMLWPSSFVVLIGGCVLVIQSVDIAVAYPACWCERWGKVWIVAPIYAVAFGMIAFESLFAYRLKTTTDAAECNDSGLRHTLIAAIFAGLWMGLLLILSTCCFFQFPEFEHQSLVSERERRGEAAQLAKQRNREIDKLMEAAHKHTQETAPAIVLLTGTKTDSGHHALLLSFVGLAAQKKLPFTVAEFDPKSEAMRTARADLAPLQPLSGVTTVGGGNGKWYAQETNLADVRIEIHASPRRDAATPAVPLPNSTSGGGVAIELQPKRHAWRLSNDVMTVVFRFCGPAALASIAGVCTAWQSVFRQNRMLAAWWIDATGEKMLLSTASASPAPAAAGTTALATTGGTAAAAVPASLFPPESIGTVLKYLSMAHRRASMDLRCAVHMSGTTNPSDLQFTCVDLSGLQAPIGLRHRLTNVLPPCELVISVVSLVDLIRGPNGAENWTERFAPTLRRITRDVRGANHENCGRAHLVWFTHVSEFRAIVNDPVRGPDVIRHFVRLPSAHAAYANIFNRELFDTTTELPPAGTAPAQASAIDRTAVPVVARSDKLFWSPSDETSVASVLATGAQRTFVTPNMTPADRLVGALRSLVLAEAVTDPAFEARHSAIRVWLSDGAITGGGDPSNTSVADHIRFVRAKVGAAPPAPDRKASPKLESYYDIASIDDMSPALEWGGADTKCSDEQRRALARAWLALPSQTTRSFVLYASGAIGESNVPFAVRLNALHELFRDATYSRMIEYLSLAGL